MDYAGRIARVRAAMAAQGIDVLLLSPSTDLTYLTGVGGRLRERLTCCALDAGAMHFVAPGFELGNLGGEARALFELHGWNDGEDPFALLGSVLPAAPEKIAIGGLLPAWAVLGLQALRPGCGWVSADPILQGLRAVKDEDEYRLIKQVQERSCRAFERLLAEGLCGKTELEVAKRLVELSEAEGVVNRDTFPIVAAGPNSALPHHHTGDRVIAEGDVVVIDFGGENREGGYHADTTRTVAVGRVPDGFAEIYEVTRRANAAAFAASRPGVACEEVDRAARAVIEAAGYGEYFTHRLGHGLGLDIHEDPYLAAGNRRPLAAGNVHSNEPGIYIPGRYGVRIEDMVFVHADGAERLTPLDHALRVVG